MSEIQFMEKPDWVSWDNVRICLNTAHKSNIKKGFEMINSNISTEELIEKNKGAHCYIALIDDKVVGVSSIKIIERPRWWVRHPIAYYFCDGILPEYRGTDVYFGLNKLRDKFVRESGVKIHLFTTNEHNKTVISINKKYGYKLVHFSPTLKGANYYSVTMAKWDDGCPFPDWFVNLYFNLSKAISKALWKPGYKRRFWFN